MQVGSDGAVCRGVEVQFQCEQKQDYGCGSNKWWGKLEDQWGGEEVKAFKYLGVWFDKGMRGNVQLEKMKKEVEECAGKT